MVLLSLIGVCVCVFVYVCVHAHWKVPYMLGALTIHHIADLAVVLPITKSSVNSVVSWKPKG